MRIRLCTIGLNMLVAFCLISCAGHKIERQQPSPQIVQIDNSTFSAEVDSFNGFAVVLFYNKEYWQSRDMEQRFEYFAGRYAEYAKFCKFHWDINAEAAPYKLEMLPTMVLYKSGAEIDRMKGIPPDKAERLKFNDDIEMWLLKNVVGLEGDQYTANFKYFFKNSYKLTPSNF